MKKIASFCLFFSVPLFFLQATAANGNNAGANGMDPEVVAQISQTAVDKAASPDGIKGILGILIGPQKFEGSITNGQKTTSQKIGVFGLTAGLEYAKSFKNKLFLAVQILADIAPKKKKEDSWKALNEDFDSRISDAGERKAKLQTDMITPSLGLKAGYLFRKQRCVAYLKLGISRISGKYTYDLNGKNFATASVNAIAPNIAIGGEYRINKKIGSSMEIGFPIKKRIHKKTINGIEHKSKISRVEVRILGTYTISKTDSMPNSLSDLSK